jgi:hypothetical protein
MPQQSQEVVSRDDTTWNKTIERSHDDDSNERQGEKVFYYTCFQVKIGFFAVLNMQERTSHEDSWAQRGRTKRFSSSRVNHAYACSTGLSEKITDEIRTSRHLLSPLPVL